ncbi:hypothetical protein PREVCOP_03824 [Segatella copri DSM 18205]|uniref:Uncharacterized protein n=1 Tax=Segatella copri DSM 18205 TaxID=537011 RepID=D1P9D2_9BACT|nr:hypothetical protein PREVCOP_03824 [Segatella copri DSM 18205]
MSVCIVVCICHILYSVYFVFFIVSSCSNHLIDMRLNLWDKPSSTPYWHYISAKIQKIFRKVI